LLGDAPRFLKPGGHLMMEIGFDQSEKLRRMVEQGIWQLIDILPDLQGIPRIAVLQLI
jgi:methylase of polypeptide subunit release factors